jgi:AcrR family transcriptional regulator
MRAIAGEAGVSVPTLELLFGTKSRLLKAAIDVAIAGDDDAVPVLDRSWTGTAMKADSLEDFLTTVASVIGPAQLRSAGLVLAVFEGGATDVELADLAAQMIDQRTATASWIIDAMRDKAPLREGTTRREAIDTLWVLMEPAVFDRLVRQRRWTVQEYQVWFARAASRLLTPDGPGRTPV